MPLDLVVLQPLFAVCRFPRQSLSSSSASSKILSWIHREQQQLAAATSGSASSSAASSGCFLSITQTSDELSIVCRQNDLVADDTTDMKIERDWSCLKVQGSLDFGLTGILASLANPLAQAQIPIFAVSTYNTDYLLVKYNKLPQAIAVLTGEGHCIVNEPEEPNDKNPSPVSAHCTSSSSSSSKGPVVDKFQADPLVERLLLQLSLRQHPQQQSVHDKRNETFGLVAVVGWPPDRNQILESYHRFRSAVELCFDESDVSIMPTTRSHDLEKDGILFTPAVYLYPFYALHVTVASPYDLRQPVPESEEVKTDLTEQWRRVMKRATQQANWPNNSKSCSGPLLQLEIDSAQIGSNAGILLWKETTGNLQAMRECIQAATNEMKEELQHQSGAVLSSSLDTLSIPSIVHTTVLRFHREPTTPAAVVQERFARTLLPRLHEFFPTPWQPDTFSLVCEPTPYMHIPADDKHIVYQCTPE